VYLRQYTPLQRDTRLRSMRKHGMHLHSAWSRLFVRNIEFKCVSWRFYFRHLAHHPPLFLSFSLSLSFFFLVLQLSDRVAHILGYFLGPVSASFVPRLKRVKVFGILAVSLTRGLATEVTYATRTVTGVLHVQ